MYQKANDKDSKPNAIKSLNSFPILRNKEIPFYSTCGIYADLN